MPRADLSRGWGKSACVEPPEHCAGPWEPRKGVGGGGSPCFFYGAGLSHQLQVGPAGGATAAPPGSARPPQSIEPRAVAPLHRTLGIALVMPRPPFPYFLPTPEFRLRKAHIIFLILVLQNGNLIDKVLQNKNQANLHLWLVDTVQILL